MSFREMRTAACAGLELCIQSYLMTLCVYSTLAEYWMYIIAGIRRDYIILKQPKQCTNQFMQETRWREKEWQEEKQWQYCSGFLILYSTAPVNLLCLFCPSLLRLQYLTVLFHNELDMFIFKV